MKVVSAGVGAVLLTASLTLSYLSNSNAKKMIENQNAIVMKYVSDSTKALENEDLKGAKKFAKKAIQADPNNKAGFKAYEAVVEKKFKPIDSDVDTQSAPAVPDLAPAYEEDEDMGC